MFSGFYYLKTGPVFIRFLFQPNKNRGASAASYGYLACLRVHAQVHTGLSTAYIAYLFAACLALLPGFLPVFGPSCGPWWSKPQAVAVWQRSAVGQWVVHWPIRRAGAKQCRASAPRGGSGFCPFFPPVFIPPKNRVRFLRFFPYFHRFILPRWTSSASLIHKI